MLEVRPNVLIVMPNRANKYHNKMTQAGMDWLLDRAAGLTADTLTHIAVGIGTAPVSLGDLTLGNEQIRKPIATLTRDSSLLAEVFFTETEANFNWTEIGLFAAATDTLGSGKLVARALVAEAKNDKRTATVSWEIGLQNA